VAAFDARQAAALGALQRLLPDAADDVMALGKHKDAFGRGLGLADGFPLKPSDFALVDGLNAEGAGRVLSAFRIAPTLAGGALDPEFRKARDSLAAGGSVAVALCRMADDRPQMSLQSVRALAVEPSLGAPAVRGIAIDYLDGSRVKRPPTAQEARAIGATVRVAGLDRKALTRGSPRWARVSSIR